MLDSKIDSKFQSILFDLHMIHRSLTISKEEDILEAALDILEHTQQEIELLKRELKK